MRFVRFKFLSRSWLTPKVGGPLVGLVHLWTDQRISGDQSVAARAVRWRPSPAGTRQYFSEISRGGAPDLPNLVFILHSPFALRFGGLLGLLKSGSWSATLLKWSATQATFGKH